jgi:hypothetical protein
MQPPDACRWLRSTHRLCTVDINVCSSELAVCSNHRWLLRSKALVLPMAVNVPNSLYKLRNETSCLQRFGVWYLSKVAEYSSLSGCKICSLSMQFLMLLRATKARQYLKMSRTTYWMTVYCPRRFKSSKLLSDKGIRWPFDYVSQAVCAHYTSQAVCAHYVSQAVCAHYVSQAFCAHYVSQAVCAHLYSDCSNQNKLKTNDRET